MIGGAANSHIRAPNRTSPCKKYVTDLCVMCISMNINTAYQFLACDCEAVTHAIVIDFLSVRTSVRPSVRLSVKRVYCDKTKAPSEKSSIMTNRKLPTSFPTSLR